jgi:hypothetical protein
MKTPTKYKLGIYDKFGIEIKEGDVIQLPHAWERNKFYTVTIVWRHSVRHGIGFYEKYKDVYKDPDGEYYRRVGEVVGNIHVDNVAENGSYPQ